ncbi:MAG: DUF2793 domain-containing protein, partial [Rhizobiales bacterium]|nr:DUF2793 domain-containing protein [Hyphomicrobiales bacterium]
MPTPHLGLPYIDQGQAQKEVTHNQALKLLDGLVQLSVKDRVTTAPPASPSEGDRWIVPSGATGVWAGKTNQIALWTDAAWTYFVPLAGWVCFIEAEGVVVYANSAWQSVSVLTANGASIGMNINEQEVVVSGATTDTAIVIPARAIVLAVSTRTTVAITGAASYDCGEAGGIANKFGGTLGVALNSTNIGVVGPTAYYTDTAVRLTANGGS